MPFTQRRFSRKRNRQLNKVQSKHKVRSQRKKKSKGSRKQRRVRRRVRGGTPTDITDAVKQACQAISTAGGSTSIMDKLQKIIKDDENKSIKLIFTEKPDLQIQIRWIIQEHSDDKNIIIALPSNDIYEITDGTFMHDGILFVAKPNDDQLTQLLEKSRRQIEIEVETTNSHQLWEQGRMFGHATQRKTTTNDITDDVKGACQKIYTITFNRDSKEETEKSIMEELHTIIKDDENKSIKLIFNEKPELQIPIRLIKHDANIVTALPRNDIYDITDGTFMHDGIFFVAKPNNDQLTNLLEAYDTF